MSRGRGRRLALGLLPYLLTPGLAPAAELGGVVMDYGRPAAEAEVLVAGPDGVVLGRTVSDQRGRFRFELPLGSYRLGVFLAEYAPVWMDGLEVGEEGRTVEVEITPAAFVDEGAPPPGDCD